ncbi:hypothetical protein LTR20_008713 [Exophiala xenobiotica]|nr:hypothetical protein LTR40_001419 [Exophiala xenobiotica]KAK5364777.1 hypothetical protein LTS13_008604 [Exophiala xenobiotica]KAK5392461.1 hypothetical protein LTR79_009927 [Exophiala xenobiotica]KAK5457362.1 hypothetical protein LTR20_008713 [Exophiala xenobiotica]KAK5511305.1 hypothetical protein LTR07_009157 [Exophiala xenobiotica]
MSVASDSPASSPTDGLPPSSYDGSHLPWRTFRHEVLSPHGIRVLETPPKERIPTTFLKIIETASRDTSRFDNQKTSFWNQVLTGRGFGPSPLFPPNLLPPIEKESCLARCYVSPGATMYCPFLTFERAYGNNQHRVESANNQCAIGGAYCVRALQMLYARAWKGEMMPELPVTFSCTIDNSFALLNLHWIDQGQAYCMAPLCQFDLSKDVHFSKFLVWIQAIGDWALTRVLPLVKEAVHRLQTATNVPPTPGVHPAKLRLDTRMNNNDLIMSSLKTAFDDIPWRFDGDDYTPSCSSTASWGSPMVTEVTFQNVNYPSVRPPRSNTMDPSTLARKRTAKLNPSPATPPPAYLQNQDMVWQKRFNHAMDEIRELQQQMQTLKRELDTAQTALRDEMISIKSGSESSTPSTPKVASSSQIPATMKSSPRLLMTKGWQCASLALTGYILSSFIPNTMVRAVAWGCIANACVFALVCPNLFNPKAIKNVGLPSFWLRKK